MKDPPADDVIPVPAKISEPEVIEAPISVPAPKFAKPSCDCEETSKQDCCGGSAVTTVTHHYKDGSKHHTHIVHKPVSEMTSDEKGLAAIAKTAIEVMGNQPEPMDSLAKRAMGNIQ